MSFTLGQWTYDESAVASLRTWLDGAVARFPERYRTGYALPPNDRGEIRGDGLADLVPPDMWVGTPADDGRVRFRRFEPEPPELVRILYPDFVPNLLNAYLFTQRIHRLPVPFDGRVYQFVSTPAHNPGFDYRRLTGLWHQLILRARYLPVAETEDGTGVLCLDCGDGGPVDTPPVVAFDCDELFRLQPGLFSGNHTRAACAPLSRPAFESLESLFAALPEVVYPEVGARRTDADFDRVPDRFDWEPLLPPSPPPEEQSPEFPDTGADVVRPHLDRIRAKLRLLKLLDPAFLVWGSETHRYNMNPTLTADERLVFERGNGCLLPVAYAQFLTCLGNGGMGIWRAMPRVEYSGAQWASYLRVGAQPDVGRLAEAFPHRKYYNPDTERMTKRKLDEYNHPKQIRGTVSLGEFADDEMRLVTLLLVITGPERGHVWADHRSRVAGVKPIVRRGPLSFLMWYEFALDNALSGMRERYEQYRSALRGG